MVVSRDMYAPHYIIEINDKVIPEEIAQFITSVSVEDDIDMFNKISLHIEALQFTAKGNVIDIIESRLFAPSNIIKVRMGYGQSTSIVGVGEIVKNIPSFDRDGASMDIVAYDPLYRLSKKKHVKVKKFNGKISQVFQEVISSHSKPKMVFIDEIGDDDNVVRSWAQTTGTSDYDFLKKIAASRGLDFWVEFNEAFNVFHAVVSQPNDNAKPSLSFTYFEHDDEPFKTLLDFKPELNTNFQVSDVVVRSWAKSTKQKIETFVRSTDQDGAQSTKFKGPDSKNPQAPQSGGSVQFKFLGETFDIINTKPFKDEEEAKKYANAYLKERMNGYIIGTGTVIGVEVLISRIVVELKGITQTYSGNYYVERVTHRMSGDENYICQIDVRKIVKPKDLEFGGASGKITLNPNNLLTEGC